MTPNDALTWVNLTPTLAAEGEALRVLHHAVTALCMIDGAGERVREAIRRVRSQTLLALDTCSDEERQFARVCVAVLCDLRGQGWMFRVVDGSIQAAKSSVGHESPAAEKMRVRAGLLFERDSQLREPAVRQFIARMERRRRGPSGEWVSIYNLMRDGKELASALRAAADLPVGPERVTALRQVIIPYLQVVDDSVCHHTGLPLKDIWRYFRTTWVNTAKTIPGRNVWFLVRDAAAPYHPVIGIAALSSAIVQLTVRDAWIGWEANTFLARLAQEANDTWAHWVTQALDEQINGLYLDDFLKAGILTLSDLSCPTSAVIEELGAIGKEAREHHQRYPKVSEHKAEVRDDTEWEKKAKSYLFRAKRATTLAALLTARIRLQQAGFYPPTGETLRTVLHDRNGQAALKEILRRVKASHVGVDMMDIGVCGAVQPYNALLSGKLIALLMASPEVIAAYTDRYTDTASVIASSMAGRVVRRQPRLVFLGTTSLYGAGSSQYNRIRMPASVAGGATDAEIRYHELGRTLGFGSFHFSPDTLAEFDLFWAQGHGARLVHSIFGEGVNPRLRKIRDALEAVGLNGEYILRHGDRRIIYGVPLVSNFREVLIGVDDQPNYLLPATDPSAVTRCMADYWIKRWLAPRISRAGLLDQVAQHTLTYPIRHGARVILPSLQNDEPASLSLFDEELGDSFTIEDER